MKIRGKTLGKQVLSVLLTLAMLLGIAPGMTRQAYAANEPAAAADTYEVDGVKYYNIHSTSKGKQDIYMDMIKSPMPYTKGVNVRLWEAWLALAVQLSYAQFDDIFFYDARARLFNPNTQGENVYEYHQDPNRLRYDIDNPYANNNRQADSRWYLSKNNDKKIYDGDLAYRTSVEWVNDQEYKDGGYVKATYTIQNKNTENILAVYEVDFYDFEATALLPPDQGNNYVTTTVQDSTTSNSTLSTTVKNNTANAQSASVTTSTSLSSTASHTREGGTDLTFTESLNVSLENELSVGVASVSETTKVGVNVGFEATQLVKRSFSDTTGETKTDEKTITETITLPAHTQALMTTENSKSTITTKYNGPFAMDYTAKVTIKYNTQGPTKKYRYYSHTSNGKTATYTFDATARSDLYQRALVDGGTNYDSEGINWVKAREKGPMKWESASNANDRIDIDPLELCATCLPMMDTPAQFTQKVEGASISYSLWPILPLNSIKVSPPEYITFISTGGSVLGNYNYQTANMKIGDSFRTSQLNLTGLDTDNVEFYNFSKNNGHWVIADANGNEQEGDNLPVKLVDEYGIVVKAVRPGTCYLKYVIDENCYAVANNRTSFIKNSDLTGGTAGIKINVAAAPVTITVENNYTNGTVDADPDYLDSDDKADTTRFYVTCVDNNDNGKNLEYEWEAMEIARQGIMITTNNFGYSLVEFSKPGTYHVRVKTKAGDDKIYYSDWYDIEATGSAANGPGFEDPVIGAAEDTEFVIVGDYEGTSGARPDPMETVSRLNVYAFDPTGKMLPVRYVWKAQETEGIEVTDQGMVTFTEPGTYHVRVESPDNPDYHSDWKEITAKQGFHTVTFETYGGDGIEAETVEHGKRLKKPADPKKENAEEPAHLYSFGGWYTTKDFTTAYDFSAPVTEDMTLYAKWIEDVRPVIAFHMNDGTGKTSFFLADKAGRCPCPRPASERDGYAFVGWFTAPEGGEQVTDDTVYSENTDVYARWKPGKSAGNETKPSAQEDSEENTAFNLFYNNIEPDTNGFFTKMEIPVYAGGVKLKEGLANSGKSSSHYTMSATGSVSGADAFAIVNAAKMKERKQAVSAANSLLILATEGEGSTAGEFEYQLPVSYTKPTLKLTATSAAIKAGVTEPQKVYTVVTEKKSTGAFEPIDLSDAKLTFGSAKVSATGNMGEVEIEISSKLNGKLSVQLPTWSEAVEVKFNVKESKNDVITATMNNNAFKSVILNNNATADEKKSHEAYKIEVRLNNEALSSDKTITVAAPKNAANGGFKLLAGSEDITTAGGTISDGELTLSYDEAATSMKPGTYTYKFSTAGKGKYSLKVVVNKTVLPKAVTLKQQAKLNVVTGQRLVLVPTLKAISGTIESADIGENAKFECEYNEDTGMIIIGAKDGQKVANNEAIDLVVNVKVSGITCAIPVKSMAVSTKPTVKISKVNVASGAEGTANVLSTYKQGGKVIGITPKTIEIVGGPKAEYDEDNKTYTVTGLGEDGWGTSTKGKVTSQVKINDDGTITVNGPAKSTSVKVNVYFSNLDKAVSKTMSVKIKK